MAEVDIEALKRRWEVSIGPFHSRDEVIDWARDMAERLPAIIAALERAERVEKALAHLLNAYLLEFGTDGGRSLDAGLDHGPANNRWVLSVLDRAIVEAAAVLTDHPFGKRAKEIIAMDDEWREKLWPDRNWDDYTISNLRAALEGREVGEG